MDKALAIAEGTLPILIKNTRFHVSIAGWPAAVSVIAFCGAYVAVYAIKANHPEIIRRRAESKKPQPSEAESEVNAA